MENWWVNHHHLQGRPPGGRHWGWLMAGLRVTESAGYIGSSSPPSLPSYKQALLLCLCTYCGSIYSFFAFYDLFVNSKRKLCFQWVRTHLMRLTETPVLLGKKMDAFQPFIQQIIFWVSRDGLGTRTRKKGRREREEKLWGNLLEHRVGDAASPKTRTSI